MWNQPMWIDFGLIYHSWDCYRFCNPPTFRSFDFYNLSLDHFGFCHPRLFKSGDYLNLMTFSNLLFEEEKKDAYLSAFLLWFMLKAAKKRVFSRLFHFASVFIYRAMKCQDMKNASPPCFGNYFSIVCVCVLAWPHFLRTKLHSPPNGDFCPRIWAS